MSTAGNKGFRVLVVVDGTARTSQIVDYAIKHVLRTAMAPRVLLLNVQPPLIVWQSRGDLQREIVERYARLGAKAIEAAGARLTAANLLYRSRIEHGEPARVIVSCAIAERADLVVIPQPERGWLSRTLLVSTGISMGSLADRVREQIVAPVLAFGDRIEGVAETGSAADNVYAFSSRSRGRAV